MLENPGEFELILIEVQSGEYVGGRTSYASKTSAAVPEGQ